MIINQAGKSSLQVAETLFSSLLTLDELGPLVDIAITYSVKENGCSHSPSCRQRGKRAAEPTTTSLKEFRGHRHHDRMCRTCGGADLPALKPEEIASVEQLALFLPPRLEAAQRRAEAELVVAARVRAADALDERARAILDGWERKLAEERQRAEGRSADVLSVATGCCEDGMCTAEADVSFDPRTLKVDFRCRANPMHGRLAWKDDETYEIWKHWDEAKYDTLALIASLIAEDDPCWSEVYGTRADDWRAVTAALRAFDEANPQPMDLGLNVRCGLCSRRMALHERESRADVPSMYECGHRHTDGRFHHEEKADVHRVVDRVLLDALNGRFSWVTAPELAPAPAALVAYADYLTAKIATYDAHIGAAKADAALSRQHTDRVARLEQVGMMQEHGVFAVAGPDALVREPWRSRSARDDGVFTDLGRALLVDRVVCHRDGIEVFTRLDEGTALYRRLYAEDLRQEIRVARAQLQMLEDELTELEETPAGPPDSPSS
ncbi:hypothetical protein ITP53_19290 [Nonomuraea sp. K274]|uniref:Uncharacterized protein n=1 Tax=Nonomuraea cypriaca TaxID=1187855 RepID=A0A931AD26_9ACTN|nr:hypothetical protein [Nonomuraea cypriaca]MBF8187840.1 hypothetical protein [Nonomuraea cypriaca]